jgi:hypothetical protein
MEAVELEEDEEDLEYDEEDDHNLLEGHTALKFLSAGGIAGAGVH